MDSLAFIGTQPGFFEMFLIFTVVLLLFGADSLPKFARQFGRLMEELRRASQDFRDQVTRADVEIKHATQDLWKDDHYDPSQDDYHHDDYHHDDYHHDEDLDDYHADHHDMDAGEGDHRETDQNQEDHDAHYQDDHGEAAIAAAGAAVAKTNAPTKASPLPNFSTSFSENELPQHLVDQILNAAAEELNISASKLQLLYAHKEAHIEVIDAKTYRVDVDGNIIDVILDGL